MVVSHSIEFYELSLSQIFVPLPKNLYNKIDHQRYPSKTYRVTPDALHRSLPYCLYNNKTLSSLVFQRLGAEELISVTFFTFFRIAVLTALLR